MTPYELRRAAAQLDAGVGHVWRELPPDAVIAGIVDIARETGAPRARLLRVIADALESNASVARETVIATVSARQSALVLAVLPALTAVAAELFGVRSLGFLLGGWAGWCCLGIGVAASFLGWKWMERLRHDITPPAVTTGIVADVCAEILAVTGLRPIIVEELRQLAVRWGAASEWSEVEKIRSSARDSGIPVVGLIRAVAEEQRRVARLTVREDIERLPGRMLVPLGVCLFPAFIVLTVIPAVAGMMLGFFRGGG